MTDVIDDAMSWEQRREMRRKKRQELLAEADKLVGNDDSVSTRISQHKPRLVDDEDDDYEKERLRRRKEREERRRKEREDMEKQLREEEEMRAERDKKREERRKQREAEREEAEREAEKETMEQLEAKEVTEEIENQIEENKIEEPEVEENKVEENKVEEPISQPPPQAKPVVRKFSQKTTPRKSASEDGESEVQRKLNEIKQKRQSADKKRFNRLSSTDASSETAAEKLKRLEERKLLREKQRLEEEEREKQEAADREAKHKEKLRLEREERERRRAEAEAKRQADRRKLSTKSEESGESGNTTPSRASTKSKNTAINEKVGQLNKHINDGSKPVKVAPVSSVKSDSLVSRVEKYAQQANKQEVKKGASVTGSSDVSDRKNKWESGAVYTSDRTTSSALRKDSKAGSLSARKNLWESGKVGSAASQPAKIDGGIKRVGGLSNLKNQYLKQAGTESNKPLRKDAPVTIKAGVMKSLDAWERGAVGGGPSRSASTKATTLSASGVNDRLNKWKNLTSEASANSAPKKSTEAKMIFTGVSQRKNVFESKPSVGEESNNANGHAEEAEENGAQIDNVEAEYGEECEAIGSD